MSWRASMFAFLFVACTFAAIGWWVMPEPPPAEGPYRNREVCRCVPAK